MGKQRIFRVALLLWFAQAAVGPPCLAGSKWDDLKKAGDAAYGAADYEEAEKQFQAALVEASRFQENDKRRGTTVYNLALVLQTEEKYSQAEPLYLQDKGS